MEKTIAKIISYGFHPLLIPLFSLFIMLKINILSIYIIPETVKWLILGMVSSATIAFPGLMMWLFVKVRIIRSLQMEEKEERQYPYLIFTIVYFVLYLLFNSIKIIPPIILINILGTALLLICVLIINFWWKISIHMAAIGGMTGSFISIAIRFELNLLLLISVLIIISGMVGFARLKLNAHTQSQIYAGFIMGISAMMGMYIFF